MKFVCGFTVLILSCCIKSSIQLGTGAPVTACPTLQPSHRGIQPQGTPSPFTIKATVLLDRRVSVKIETTDDHRFAGFLIQGRTNDENTSIGGFDVPGDTTNHRALTCVSNADSVTHFSATVKSEIEMIWLPPVGFTGQVYFTGTVLQEMSVFWGGVRSPMIDITDATDDIYANCDGTRNCYGAPSGCIETQNCMAVAVVHFIDGIFRFELQTGLGAAEDPLPQYIAFGISNGRTMADGISVIECTVEANQINAYTSFTEEAPNRGSPRTNIPQNIIRLVDSSYRDNQIRCIVERDTVSTVHGIEFNLLNEQFYVHVVAGSSLSVNSVGYHNLARYTTAEQDYLYIVERSDDSIYDNCNGDKVCFGAPFGCIFSRNCEAVAVVHVDDDEFRFELKTTEVSETIKPAYIAFGISDEPSMADISVIECTVEADIIQGYISQTEITETGRGSPRTDIPQTYVQLKQWTYENGKIHCIIERDAVTTVRGREYDLINDEYFIHLAVGDALGENSVSYHNINRVTSTGKISLNRTTREEPTTDEPEVPDSIYDGCGVTQGCFGHPNNCVNNFNCLAITTINLVDSKFQFEMLTNSNGPKYVAFGLSSTFGMFDASVIECVLANDEIIAAYTSYTEGSPNASPRTNIPQNIIRLVSSSYVDGQIRCVIERDTVSEVRGQRFDLMNDKFHLLIASGTLLNQNSVDYHDIGRLVSSEPQSLLDLSFASANSNAVIKVHGIFMIVAWVGTSSIGIILARYFKKTWVGSQLCGKDQWFAWHRICMICTGVLTLTAFTMIFVEIDGWSAEDNPHAILGTIVAGICLLQILGALFRPAPDAKHRVYFNWGHMLGGSTGQILAIITIFFSVTLTKAELSDEFYWVFGVFCVFYIIFYILFNIVLLVGNKQKQPTHGEAPFSFVRKLMLGFFIIVTILFVVALSVLVGLAPI